MGTSAQPTDRRTFVLAGNFNEFRYWCQVNEKNWRDRRSVIYVDRWDRLMGYRDFDFVVYGTFSDRWDARQIWDALMARMQWEGNGIRAARE